MKLIQFRAMLRFMELSPKEANINLIYFDLLGEIKAGGMLETKNFGACSSSNIKSS